MWTATAEGRKLVQEISKDIVHQIAPEEMDLFDELILEYFQNPAPPDLSSKPKDDPLGLGLSEMLIAVSPATAAMVSVALDYLITEIIKSSQTESAELIKNKIKELFNPEKADKASPNKKGKDIPPLTKEQLEEVRKLAIKQAVAFKIAPDKAKRMADSLIGSLSIS